MENIISKFEESIIQTGSFSHGLEKDVSIDKLIDAFEELFPLLRLLGTAFYFVEKDVAGKLKIIKENKQKNEFDGTLLEYMHTELDNKKSLSSKSGTARNVLRLSRALYFIELFLQKLNNIEQNLKEAAQESYATSLSDHHAWTVRKAVGLAFYTLPSRQKFLEQLELNVEEPDVFDSFVKAMNEVRFVINGFYTKFEIENL